MCVCMYVCMYVGIHAQVYTCIYVDIDESIHMCHRCVSDQDSLISITDLCQHQQGSAVLIVWYSNLFRWGASSQWSSK